MASLDARAPPARRARRGAAGAHDGRRPTRARAAIDAVAGLRVIGDEFVGRPGRRRLGPAADRDRRARHRPHRLRGRRRRCATPTTSTSSSPRTRRSCWSSALGQPRRRDLERFAHDFDAIVAAARSRRARRPRSCARRARWTTRSSSRRARRSSARPSVVAVDDAVGRVSCESIAGYPPGIPALLPGERITAEVIAYLRELVGRRRAPARRQRPRVRRRSTCSRPDGSAAARAASCVPCAPC